MVSRTAGLVALLVVASGCSGLASEPTPDPSVTPAPVPQTETPRYPSWAPAGNVDVPALLAGHREAVGDNYTATVVWNRTVEGRDLEIRRLTVRSTLWVAGDDYRLRTSAALHHEDDRYDLDPGNAVALRLGDGTDAYATDDTEFLRDGDRFERRPANATRYRAEFGTEFRELLTVVNTRVDRNGSGWYRIDGDGLPGENRAKDYRMRALVAPDGSVRRVDVTYLNGRSVVSVTVRVSPGARVDAPGWLPAAREATTDGTGTPEATP